MLPGRTTIVAFVLFALLLGNSAPLAAHARLERSTPAAGATLRAPVPELRLVFSEPVDLRYTSLTLRSPAGDVIPLEALRADPAAGGRELVTTAPALAAPGQYRVEWRTMSADGHVITGAFSFTALAGALASSQPARSQRADAPHVDPATHRVPAGSLPPQLQPQSWPNLVVRLLHFVAMLALIGTATFRTVLLPGGGLMPSVHSRLVQSVRGFGLAAVLLLLVVLPLRLWLQSAAMHGPERALEPAFLGALLTRVAWGQAWLVQAGLALLAGFALISGLVPVLAFAALGIAFAPAFQGHAAAMENWRALALAADGVHVLAAGAWIGSLMVILFAALPVLFRDGLERGGHDTGRLVARFTPLALFSVTLLAGAGLATSLLRFHDARELLTTGYGRTLLGKLCLVALVLAAGWYNWKRARPALPLHAGVRTLRHALTLEVLFALAALAVTASLVALPTP